METVTDIQSQETPRKRKGGEGDNEGSVASLTLAKKSEVGSKNRDRWRNHKANEDYIRLSGELMYPRHKLGPYGYQPENGKFPFERIHTLGYLTSPMRRRLVIEKWCPYDIAVFESSIMLYGKKFHIIKRFLPAKTVKDIIEFYYEWKKTSHYDHWKKVFRTDERELPSNEEA